MQYEISKERVYLHAPAATVSLAVTIEGKVDGAALLEAIGRAWRCRALLRTRARQTADGPAFYEPSLSAIPPELRVEEEGADVESLLLREAVTPFDVEAGRYLRCRLIPGAEKSVWILSAHHLAGDGLSLLFFAEDSLRALADAELTFAEQPLRIFTARDLPRGASLPLGTAALCAYVNHAWKKGGRGFTAADRARMTKAYWEKRAPALRSFDIGPKELEDLLSACRLRGVTLTPLLGAAFAKALGGMAEIGVTANIRPAGLRSMGNWATGVSVRLDADRDVWSMARECHRLMREKLDSPGGKYFLVNFMRRISPTLVDAAYYAAFDGYENADARRMADLFGYTGERRSVSLSNLTRAPIADTYGPYRVSRIEFAPPLVPNAALLVGAVSIGGTLTVCAQSDRGAEALEAISICARKTLAAAAEI